MSLRPDLAIIADHVARGARVLDIGCGDVTGDDREVGTEAHRLYTSASWRSMKRSAPVIGVQPRPA